MVDVTRLLADLARVPAPVGHRIIEDLTDAEAALLWRAFAFEDPAEAAV